MQKINQCREDEKALFGYRDSHENGIDFTGKVVNKPWGYEYLMFTTPEVSIWMLYIKKGQMTSMHCHPNKKTSLLVISGEVKGETLNKKFILKEKEGVIYDKRVFHTTETTSENGAFVIEVETPTDKMDLFRLRDKYHRSSKTYTEKKNITDKTYNYLYLALKNNKDSANVLGKYDYLIRTFKDNKEFSNNIKKIQVDVAVLLNGKIDYNNKEIIHGDILESEALKKGNITFPIKVLLIHERKNIIKLSDYVLSFLEKKGVKDIFLVSGGNLMYLLESLRVNKNINYLCNHHEQASAMAAEGYSKFTNNLGVVMVTSGPGGTNALTGVTGAWIDSNPMLIISGQSYSTQTVGKSGLRQLGVQELNIVDIVKPITKYAVMVTNPKKIKYYLEKCIHIATTGRPGPVWLDIPINVQMAKILKKELTSFKIPKPKAKKDISKEVDESIKLIQQAERPIIFLGNGVRLGKAEKEFFELANKLKIPIVTSRNANDLIWEDHPDYVGRVGSFGQRYSNFAIQNSDLLLSLGSRIGLAVTGWAHKDFARCAKKIIVDVDYHELEKPTIKPDIAVNCDVKDFMTEMLLKLKDYKPKDISKWKTKIKHWKKKYPIILPGYKNEKAVNTYYFTEILSQLTNKDDVVLTDMGMSFQCVMQAFRLKKGQRLFTSSGFASMGWGLPGAIGACVANGKKRVICVSGDGGLMMNIQELQTLKHYNLPIKLFIFNNKGYSSIRETQKTYFEGFLGSDKDSGVSMPDFIKLAEAHGLKTKRINNQKNLIKDIKQVLDYDGPVVCDLNISENQPVQPKQGQFNRPDGKPVPRPIEDMLPYLTQQELEKEMLIDIIPFDPYKKS